ncbi:hypothetical protein A9X04_04810 [Mycobacterium sp. E3247]|nr:hypothetical protein A9X04_04810 [Mycobacterium sp. E3247]
MAQQLRKISGDPNWARDAQRRCKQRFFYALRKNHEMRFLLEQTENRMESTAEERRRALLLGAELQPMSTVKITLEKVRLNNPWPSGNS